MHKEYEYEKKQQENVSLPPGIIDPLDGLSDVWRELLGNRSSEKLLQAFPGETSIPTIKSDPWSALLQAKGIEVVDLQRMHLQISDQEVEQILQVIPDDPPDARVGAPKGALEHSAPDGGCASGKHPDTH